MHKKGDFFPSSLRKVSFVAFLSCSLCARHASGIIRLHQKILQKNLDSILTYSSHSSSFPYLSSNDYINAIYDRSNNVIRHIIVPLLGRCIYMGFDEIG